MKGVILAAGKGTRLLPITKVVKKEILPVYNKPMIYYPIETLAESGIKDILIIIRPGVAGQFVRLIGSGKEFGARISYAIQEEQLGIAHALAVAEEFSRGDPVAVICADNIFEDTFADVVERFKTIGRGAVNAVCQVSHPERFGVFALEGDKIVDIAEKPQAPSSNWISTGFYLFDHRVFDFIRRLQPSPRGEFEITDVLRCYLKEGTFHGHRLQGKWIDAGTFDALLEASILAAEIQKRKTAQR